MTIRVFDRTTGTAVTACMVVALQVVDPEAAVFDIKHNVSRSPQPMYNSSSRSVRLLFDQPFLPLIL